MNGQMYASPTGTRSTPSYAGALLGLVFLAATGIFGGWPWAMLCAVVLVALWRYEFTAESVAGVLLLNLLWLGLFHWTGDRRFFFPYAMQLAVQMALLFGGRVPRPVLWGGGGITMIFAAIRIFQGATPFVLFVEMLVAAVILASTAYIRNSLVPMNASTRAVAGALGSLLAFAGLAVN